jgi:hypothetical protein
MAKIQVITPDELAERTGKKGKGRSGRRRSLERTRIIEEYKEIMRDLQPGYGGDVTLEDGEEKRVVRQNLIAAANELGINLSFHPIRDPMHTHFRVITQEEKDRRPKRGGRPRKQR